MRIYAAALSAAAICAAAAAMAQSTLKTPTYTLEQAKRGEAEYAQSCASCHGQHLDDGQFAAPLRGPAFAAHWGQGGLDAPFTVMTTMMPPANPGGLPGTTYADLLAFILSKNSVAASTAELPADLDALATMAAPSGN